MSVRLSAAASAVPRSGVRLAVARCAFVAVVSSLLLAGSVSAQGESERVAGEKEKQRASFASADSTLDACAHVPGSAGESARERVSAVRLDACLRALLEAGSQEQVERASRLYLRLLNRAGTPEPPASAAVVRRHIVQMADLLPEEAFHRVVAGGSRASNPRDWSLRREAGAVLAQWWRRQDPVLQTDGNERLREHLRRVAYAERVYAAPKRPRRMDARGRVYVRYGPPDERGEVSYNEASFVKKVYRFGVPVSMSDFPQNELWLYPHIDEAGYYLFLKQGSTYRLARTVNELLPPQLRNNFSRTKRALNKSVSAMAAMRHIYRQLASYHIDFGGRYDAIDRYVARQEERAMKSKAGLSSGGHQYVVGEGVGSQRVIVTEDPVAGIALPNQKVRRTLEQSRLADERARRRREEAMPRQDTRVLGAAAPLPVAVRTARFLEEDGTTRTEVYWGMAPGALRLSERQIEAYGTTWVSHSRPLLLFTAIRQNTRYGRERMRRKQFLLKGTMLQAARRAVPPQQIAFRTPATGTYHLGLQWAQHLAHVRTVGEGGPRVVPGALVKSGLRHLDSLHTLPTAESRLVLSDLKPMILPDAADAGSASLADAAILYPFSRIAPDAPLVLYFEAYHLAYGADDQAHYTVEYEVQRRTERGGLAGLFRGNREERTSTQTTYTSPNRMSGEFILLDLGEWEKKRKGMIRVVVRLTDETTGQETERSIRFQVQPQE